MGNSRVYRQNDHIDHEGDLTDRVLKWFTDKAENPPSVRPCVSEWLYGTQGRIYVRWWNMPSATRPAFVLANVELMPSFRGKGYFTTLRDKVEKLATIKGYDVIVEKVLNERLELHLLVKGYRLIPGSYPVDLIWPLSG